MSINHEKPELLTDKDVGAKCIGCKICEIVCSLHHEGDQVSPKRSRIEVLFLPEKTEFHPMVCLYCNDAPCISSCPVEALCRNEENHIIRVDEEACTGCEVCVEACPYGAIRVHPEKETAMICDRCGGEFLCVKNCPEDILGFIRNL